MTVVISNVLDTNALAVIQEAANALHYEDGRKTAGRYAKDVKANLQAQKSPELDAIFEQLRKTFNGHELVRSIARPRRYARMLLSRYRSGMTYGTHVDDPVMNGCRTDLSFTLSLSDPDSYSGGELVMEDPLEHRAIRLQAGDMVLYPTSALHRVEPVVEGERMAVVGWITSWVRDPSRREILHDLDVAARMLHDESGKTPAFDRVFKTKANLSRMWYDD